MRWEAKRIVQSSPLRIKSPSQSACWWTRGTSWNWSRPTKYSGSPKNRRGFSARLRSEWYMESLMIRFTLALLHADRKWVKCWSQFSVVGVVTNTVLTSFLCYEVETMKYAVWVNAMQERAPSAWTLIQSTNNNDTTNISNYSQSIIICCLILPNKLDSLHTIPLLYILVVILLLSHSNTNSHVWRLTLVNEQVDDTVADYVVAIEDEDTSYRFGSDAHCFLDGG